MSQERLMQVLLAPQVSEKSANATEQANRYVFKVLVNATKTEVKQAVEQLFEVSVVDVTTVKVKGKQKRTGRTQGRRSDWKKAYVRLAEGQEIDVFGAE